MTERQRFLWSSAQQAFHDAPELSHILLLALDRECKRAGTPLPTRAAQRLCASCFTLLVPGFSCKVTQRKHPRRPRARRFSLDISCTRCGHTSNFPMPTPPSCRDAIGEAKQKAPAAPPPSKAQAKRKTPSAGTQQQQKAAEAKKKKRPEPAPPPSAPGADSLFGFDFVPL